MKSFTLSELYGSVSVVEQIPIVMIFCIVVVGASANRACLADGLPMAQ